MRAGIAHSALYDVTKGWAEKREAKQQKPVPA